MIINQEVILQLLSITTNISIIIVGIRLVRHMARIEFKVELMWSVFINRFGDPTHKTET